MRNKEVKHLPAHLYLINRTMTTNKGAFIIYGPGGVGGGGK